MRKFSKDMMGASAIPIILALLKNKETYGYEIMKDLEKLSSGKIIWKEGSLYPVLKKMETSKLIESVWNVEDHDRPRKYYKILPKGKEELALYLEDFEMVTDILNNLLKLKS